MAILGFGFDLQISAAGSTYASAGNLIDIDTPDIKAADSKISYLLMATPWHQFMAQLADGGTAEFTLLFNATQYAVLAAIFRTPYYFKIVASDKISTAGSSWVFQGYLNSMPKAKVDLDKEFTTGFGVKVSGPVTFAVAT